MKIEARKIEGVEGEGGGVVGVECLSPVWVVNNDGRRRIYLVHIGVVARGHVPHYEHRPRLCRRTYHMRRDDGRLATPA